MMNRKSIAVFATGSILVMGFVGSALGVAGVTDISAARVFLIIACVAAVLTVCTEEALATKPLKVVLGWGAITLLFCGPLLYGVDRWMRLKKTQLEIVAQQSSPAPTPQNPVNLASQIAASRRQTSKPSIEPLYRMVRTPTGMSAICSNPPLHATLNYWPVTFISPAEVCHDYVLIDARKADDSSHYSASTEQLLNGVSAHSGDQVFVLIYLNNGAINIGADATALAKNLSIVTQTDSSTGTTHYIDVSVSGDNVETIYGRIKINTNPNERLEIVEHSGQVRNSTGTELLSEGFDIGNNIIKLGDLRSNWEDSIFIRYTLTITT
jgi:hypothetical protein